MFKIIFRNSIYERNQVFRSIYFYLTNTWRLKLLGTN